MPTLSEIPTVPLVELQLDSGTFASDWLHCDQVANYLAQLVSHDRPDTFLYSNLLSTVLNELLETVFLHYHGSESIHCTLFRQGKCDRLELVVPVNEASLDFYRRSVAAAQGTNVAEAYTRTLLAKEAPAESLGLLELASDYGAHFELEELGGDKIRLSLEVTLEDGLAPASSSPA